MNNPSNMVCFNWQNGLIGKLAKHLANHSKIQCLQCLTLNWQIGNCQLNLPICQLAITPCIYRVFVFCLIGEKTPLYKYKDKAYAYPYLFMGFGALDDPIRASHFNYNSQSKRRSS